MSTTEPRPTPTAPTAPTARTTRLWRLGRLARRHPVGAAGALVVLGWLLLALLAPVLGLHDPLAQDLPRLQGPSGAAWFGTDESGRDVFSRVVHGARITIPLAFALVAAAAVVGTLIGAVAGYFGRWVDEVLMRFTDLIMAFPTVILAMVVGAALGASLVNAVLAAIVVSWPGYARVSRSLVLGLRESNFVQSGRLLGWSPWRSLRVDVSRNIAGPLAVLASLDLGTAVLLLSGLSFLGLGARPPDPEWGYMVSAAIDNFDKWWLGVFPGLAIASVVVALNLMGDALRDLLDPQAAHAVEKGELT